MSLKSQIQSDMKDAMRARESVRLGAIRMLQAAIKQREVDERVELDDAQVTATVERLLKQRRDSATQFEAAGRAELAAQERAEIEVLSAYLPEQAPDEEVLAGIRSAIESTGASGPADLGKVLGVLKPHFAGRVDMASLAAKVRQALSS